MIIQIIKEWLANPSGRYFDGLAIFQQLASPKIRERYEKFFLETKQAPSRNDIHFTLLISKVADIARNVQLNPRAYDKVVLVLKTIDEPQTDESQAIIEQKNAEIAAKNTEIEALKEKLAESTTEQVEELEATISELEDEVEALQVEVDELTQRKGVQIVMYSDMPDHIRAAYDRNKEITPLMASLHAEIADEKLSATKRKKLVKQLVDFDDERRANWDLIDDWSEGKETEAKSEKPEFSSDPLVAGAQIARRILRLQDNIRNSTQTAETAERELVRQNALRRIEAYQAELTELQNKIAIPNAAKPPTTN